MGITGLNTVLKASATSVIHEKLLRRFKGHKTCAIDTSIFIYKFLYIKR